MKKFIVLSRAGELLNMYQIAVISLVLSRCVVNNNHTLERVAPSSDLLKVLDPVRFSGVPVVPHGAATSRPEEFENVSIAKQAVDDCLSLVLRRSRPDSELEVRGAEREKLAQVRTQIDEEILKSKVLRPIERANRRV